MAKHLHHEQFLLYLNMQQKVLKDRCIEASAIPESRLMQEYDKSMTERTVFTGGLARVIKTTEIEVK